MQVYELYIIVVLKNGMIKYLGTYLLTTNLWKIVFIILPDLGNTFDMLIIKNISWGYF